jgi:hypothetical protein|tara:strand:- start:927 stop:2129 length:1203 start_codon:yes stop_codon:yes gene_type:complete
MKNRAFHFEIKNLLTQFVAAFDDTVISRYNKSRDRKNNIEVRYVFAPKQRVMYDIINKAQNITLPVVAINLTGITRDNDRVFNKLPNTFIPTQRESDPKSSSNFLMPVPINIEVNMSILARYMQDVDQIVSNFVPYNNPYIILTWKVPSAFGAGYDQEIRTEVLWDGNLVYDTPTDTTYSDKFRITVDTTFTIKGWLFPEQKDTKGNIYKIDNNFIAVNLANRIYSPLDNNEVVSNASYNQQGYRALSGYNDGVPDAYSETVTISAIPEITNLYYSTTGTFTQLYQTTSRLLSSHPNNFILYGKRFDYDNDFFLSATDMGGPLPDNPFYSNYQEITSAKSATISGYKLGTSLYEVVNDNITNIFLPTSTLSAAGKFVFVSANEAGWGSSYPATSSILQMT